MRQLKIQSITEFSHPGARSSQEDHVLTDQDKAVFVVADGFGGPVPGREASKAACEAVRSFLFREAGDREATLPFVLRNYFSLAGNVLFNALIHANRKVLGLNKSKNVHEKGGASLIAGFLDGDLLALANVGCCEAWLIRDGKLAELIVPKSYSRLISPYNDGQAPQVPLMALGISDDLEPEIAEYRVRPGDWLLLNTDGLPLRFRAYLAERQTQEAGPSGLDLDSIRTQIEQSEPLDNLSFSLVVF